MKDKNKFMLKILPLALIFVLFLCILNVVKVQCTELNDNIRCGDIDKNGDINISDGVILKKYLVYQNKMVLLFLAVVFVEKEH